MRAECYTLDIYCDCDANHPRGMNSTRGQYTGANKRDAHRDARRDGWIIGDCDYCSKECAETHDESEKN